MRRILYLTEVEPVLLAEVTSNHSMTVWEALNAAGVNMNEYAAANGWDGWDPEAVIFDTEVKT